VAVYYSPREGLSGSDRWWIPLRADEATGSDPRLVR
jgi:signal peptidase I